MKTPFIAAAFIGATLGCASGLMADTPPVETAQAARSGPVLTSEVVVSSDAELKSRDSKYRHVTFLHSRVDISQTLPIDASDNLTFGLSYDISTRKVSEPAGWENDDFWEEYIRTHPDWDRIPIPCRLQTLSASIGYARQIDDTWSFSTYMATSSHVATKGLLSKGWGTAASFMTVYRWQPDLSFAFGAAYDSFSDRYQFVPLLGVDWQVAENWSVAIGFPSTAVTYTLNKDLTMALELSGSGGTYYVADDPAPGIAPRSLANSKLETIEVRMGFKVSWRINDTFSINGTCGNVLYREFKYVGRGYRMKSCDVAAFAAFGGSISF